MYWLIRWLWQPEVGMIGGALEFDGIDDYVSTPFVLNPADGVFNVVAWIRGGIQGQVIISQAHGIGTGESWLGLDVSSGYLITGLVPLPLGRFKPEPIVS